MSPQVNTDEMRGFAKAQGLKSLPWVGFYRAGVPKQAFGCSPAGQKIKGVRPAIEILLANPDKQFRTDPNGLIALVE